MRLHLEWFTLLGILLFYVIVLTLATVSGIGTSYLFLLWTTSVFVIALVNYFASPTSHQPLLPLSYGIALIPFLLTMDLTIGVLSVFVPLPGRIGHIVWTEVIIAIVTSLFVSLLALPLVPFFHRAGNLKVVAKGFSIFSFVLLSIFLLVSNPYDANHPKRLFFQHTQIVSTDGTPKDSFVLLGYSFFPFTHLKNS